MGGQIKISKDGPLEVSGEFQLWDSGGNEFVNKKNKIYLCRCGQSNKKPFCDGSHKKAGFESDPNFSD